MSAIVKQNLNFASYSIGPQGKVLSVPMYSEYRVKQNIKLSTSLVMVTEHFYWYFKKLNEAHAASASLCVSTSPGLTDRDFILRVNRDLMMDTSDRLVDYISHCVTSNAGAPLIAIPVEVVLTKKDGHSNLLIIDNAKKTLEYYEPNGNNLGRDRSFYAKLISTVIKYSFTPFKGYTVVINNTTQGLQRTESFCLLWVAFILELRVFNPDFTVNELESILLNQRDPTYTELLAFLSIIEDQYRAEDLKSLSLVHTKSLLCILSEEIVGGNQDTQRLLKEIETYIRSTLEGISSISELFKVQEKKGDPLNQTPFNKLIKFKDHPAFDTLLKEFLYSFQNTLKKQYITAQSEAYDLKFTVSEREDQIKALQGQIQQLNATIAAQQQQLSVVAMEVVDEKETQLLEARKVINDQQLQLLALKQGGVNAAAQERAERERLQIEKDRVEASMRQRVKALEQDLLLVKQNSGEQNGLIKTLSDTIERLKGDAGAQLHQQNVLIAEKEAQLAATVAQNQTAENLVANASLQISLLNKEILELKTHHSVTKGEANALLQKVIYLENRLREMAGKVASAPEEVSVVGHLQLDLLQQRVNIASLTPQTQAEQEQLKIGQDIALANATAKINAQRQELAALGLGGQGLGGQGLGAQGDTQAKSNVNAPPAAELSVQDIHDIIKTAEQELSGNNKGSQQSKSQEKSQEKSNKSEKSKSEAKTENKENSTNPKPNAKAAKVTKTTGTEMPENQEKDAKVIAKFLEKKAPKTPSKSSKGKGKGSQAGGDRDGGSESSESSKTKEREGKGKEHSEHLSSSSSSYYLRDETSSSEPAPTRGNE